MALDINAAFYLLLCLSLYLHVGPSTTDLELTIFSFLPLFSFSSHSLILTFINHYYLSFPRPSTKKDADIFIIHSLPFHILSLLLKKISKLYYYFPKHLSTHPLSD